jgi:lipopolysaccharide biosynthesis glycosyltransferase
MTAFINGFISRVKTVIAVHFVLLSLSLFRVTLSINNSSSKSSLTTESINIGFTICGLQHLALWHGISGSLMMNPQAHRIHMFILAKADTALSLQCYVPTMLKYIKNVTILNRYDYRNITVIPLNINVGRFHCAYDRLFYNQIFSDVDKMLYLDTDTLVFEDLQNLWNHWAYMENKMFGVVLDRNITVTSKADIRYVDPDKKHFLPPTGLNSGVIMMNIQRMKLMNYSATKVLLMNDENTRYADQDVLNNYAFFNQPEFYVLPCKWNRGYTSECDWSNSTSGILHGYNQKFLETEKEHFAHERWLYFHHKFEEMTQIYAMFPNGTMIAAHKQRNVYYMDEGLKRLMNSIDTVYSLHLDLSQKMVVPHLLLEAIPEGELLYNRSGVNFLNKRGYNASAPSFDDYLCQDKFTSTS